jgi:hypothetical protein
MLVHLYVVVLLVGGVNSHHQQLELIRIARTIIVLCDNQYDCYSIIFIHIL